MIASAIKEPSEIVSQYIKGVLSGDIVTGRLVKLAVQRHVDDLKNGKHRGWYFDEDVARSTCLFYPLCLRHSIGEWADEPFNLVAWEAFCVWSLSGWRSVAERRRRFRKAHLSVARKNGKTTIGAGMILQHQFFDDPIEEGAQLYCVATKEEQAKLLYMEALRMLSKSPALSRRARVRKSPASINWDEHNSYFKPLGSDSEGTDGLNPHVIVMDELHAWTERHRPLKEKLETGGAARSQPLQLIITTAGDDRSELWKEEDKYAVDVLENAAVGKHIDDTYFAYICRLDDGDDIFDPANWPKANPNYGVSVKPEYLANQANTAKNRPTETNSFIRYHCNRSVSSSQREFSPEDWAKGDGVCTFGDGDYCHGGIDLGRSDDWAAIALVFPVIEGGKTTYQLKTKAWCARDGRLNVMAQPFASWIQRGLLECHSGDQIDFAEIESEIMAWHDRYRVDTWAFDPHFARDLAQRLTENGVVMFEFKQAHGKYNEPCVRFGRELREGNIRHGADPVLAWQAGNLEYKPNTAGLVMPNKSGKQWKIDGMVASIMAFSEVLFAEKQSGSFYDKNPVEMG